MASGLNGGLPDLDEMTVDEKLAFLEKHVRDLYITHPQIHHAEVMECLRDLHAKVDHLTEKLPNA